MSYELLKQKAAVAALQYLSPGQIVGVGTGSTIYYFIEALAKACIPIKGAVASSESTAKHLKSKGINVLPLEAVMDLPIYIDGTDVVDSHFYLIKGGGGALTREKVLADASRQFICIADHSKWIEDLSYDECPPLPIEVLPMACSHVANALIQLGARPHYRSGYTTDNGNSILDVQGLDLRDPPALESRLNQIPGTVANGLFTQRRPDFVLLATDEGTKILLNTKLSTIPQSH